MDYLFAVYEFRMKKASTAIMMPQLSVLTDSFRCGTRPKDLATPRIMTISDFPHRQPPLLS